MKAKARTGKMAVDIFTSEEKPAPSSIAPVSPNKSAEPYKKATVVLYNRQLDYLDRLALDIRKRTGATISRAEILRGMVDALERSGIDMTGSGSETAVRELLEGRLKGGR